MVSPDRVGSIRATYGQVRTTRNPSSRLDGIDGLPKLTERTVGLALSNVPPRCARRTSFWTVSGVPSFDRPVVASFASWHHSDALPSMSNRPKRLGLRRPTGQG